MHPITPPYRILDDNIAKRVNSLPRTTDNSGMVLIGLKRKLNMKNVHKFGLINPESVYKACEYLIKHHPNYAKIKLLNYSDWAEKCPSLFDPTEDSESEECEDYSSEDEELTDKSNAKEMKHKTIFAGNDNTFLVNEIFQFVCPPIFE